MDYITASKARSDFSGTFNRVAYGHQRLVINRHHKDAVAVIPIEDLRLLERFERQAEDAIDAAAARRILANTDEGRVSWDELKGELGL